MVLGLVLGAEALSQFVAAPWLGQLSDRYGRRTVLLASQAGALASLSLLAAADSVVFVLLARILLGLTAANFSAAAAYAADHSSPADRRQAIGILSAGLGLGGMAGPGLAGALAGVSLSAPIWIAMALSAASLLTTALWLDGGAPRDGTGPGEAVRERTSLRSLLASPAIRIVVAILLCHYVSYGLFSSQVAVFLGDTFRWNGHAFGPRELGYLLTADGAINIAVQLLLLPWLGRRLAERGLIVLVFGLLSAGYVLAGLATGIGMLALAVLCVSTGVALARPTFIAGLSVHVPRRRQGVVMGTIQSLVAVTDMVTPVLAGAIVGQRLYGAWIGAVVATALAGAVIAHRFLRLRDGPGAILP
ncbi:MFS transporter [Inquilinus limosus]|uniref:MFS transporter n=1 Tax=Inquilinus limosus TaxID=171674 RepID=UPI002379EBD2|nr:MFS transporter [Inquilinus limosus]